MVNIIFEFPTCIQNGPMVWKFLVRVFPDRNNKILLSVDVTTWFVRDRWREY